ncbi:MAG: helix-turn-helix transcriptional regulator [Clostridiales bacterium]|nr:helix-turn-helix transcriptional regulator [Clostridiales bacterium]
MKKNKAGKMVWEVKPLLKIEDCGYAVQYESLTINRPGGTPFWVFVYYHTPARLTVSDGTVWQLENSFVLYPPNYPNTYTSTTSPYIDDWIHFTQAEGNFMDTLHFPFGKPVFFPQHRMITSAIRRLRELFLMNVPNKEEIAHHELSALFLRLNHFVLEERPNAYHRHYRTLSALRQEIYANPQAGITVHQLATKANMSITYFHKTYKNCFGSTVGEDLIRSRIERAKYLIESSGYTVSEVAYRSGYESEAHFIRQFKKHTGMTPGKYRQQNNE